MKEAEDKIEEIFSESKDFSDEQYCEYLEEISAACESAAEAKRGEMQ